MLYELIAIVRPGNILEVKDIARSAGTTVLRSGGVVRGLTNWGTFLLPRKIRVHQATHNMGHYFVMRFDSSGRTQGELRKTLALDPRMIRFGVVKMGEKLAQTAKVGGIVPWAMQDEERWAAKPVGPVGGDQAARLWTGQGPLPAMY